MEVMTAKDAALNWDISQRRVAKLCEEGRIAGAEMLGNHMWVIPKDANKPIDGRIIRYANDKKIKPFIKWVGGKGQILDEIRKNYPPELGKSIKKYAEPFVGGGAVLFDVLANYDLDEVYISDSNPELINLYENIQKNVGALIKMLKIREEKYLALNEEERKLYYYEVRNTYNSYIGSSKNSLEKAVCFMFLNKTCFNGLYRVNRKGEFNVPMGAYTKPLICDENNLRAVSKALKKVRIVCGDYHDCDEFVDKNTFVYFDPPYRPLNATSSFTAYTENDFDDEDQKELAEFIKKLNERGAYVMASNSDPKNVNPEDDFFEDLYKKSKMKINRISASRAINSKGSARGKISELLICSIL